MQTIEISHSKTFDTNTRSTEQMKDTIIEAMENVSIGGLTLLETVWESTYLRFTYELGGELVLSISFYLNMNATTSNSIYMSINKKDKPSYSDKLAAINGNYGLKWTTSSTSTTFEVSFYIQYVLKNSKIRVLYTITSALSSTFSSNLIFDDMYVIEDGTTEGVVGYIGSSIALYRVNTATSISIDTYSKPFASNNNILKEYLLTKVSDSIIGYLENAFKIYNTTLNTNNNNSSKTLIESDGVRYRQINGFYWVADS